MVEVWLIVGLMIAPSGIAVLVGPTVEFPTEASCQISAREAEAISGAARFVLVCLPAIVRTTDRSE